MGWLRKRLVDLATRALTKPRETYNNILPNDLTNLRRYVRKGDVVLVDGEQRVSEVIKYLTQSTWSHSVLYVGDELLRRHPERREELVAAHGDEAAHLVVEALPEGVSATPLVKYASCNLRVCRPYGIQRDHLQQILDEVINQIGFRYDLKNVFDLARYFLPVSLVPRRFRRQALEFGSGLPTSVICSSLIARAFQNVGFPILPTLIPSEEPARPLGLFDRLRRLQPPYPALFHQIPSLITPRDFDLSPYFTIVKFNAVEASFDYRRVKWTATPSRAAGGGSRS
jgi:hypothetical protein